MKRYKLEANAMYRQAGDGDWIKWDDMEILIRGLEEQLQLEIDLEFYYTKGWNAINNE